MCSRWCMLALVAGALVNVLVADDVNREVGARCDPGLEGSWGLWCNVNRECDGTNESGSNRCLEGETAPPPKVICCLQEGPAPPEEVDVVVEPSRSSRNGGLNWNFGTRPKPDTKSTIKAAPIVTNLLFVSDPLAVAKKKCIEYSSHVYEMIHPPVLMYDVEPVNESRCLMTERKTIPGTVPALEGEFPHMVALGSESPGSVNGVVDWKCSGSLISELFVVTTAFCTYDRPAGPLRWALLGGTSLSDTNAQRIRVVESLTHPAYYPMSMYYDIALLRLESSPRFSPEVRPACIGNEMSALNVAHGGFGTHYDVAGWNLAKRDAKSDWLMREDLYQFATDECASRIKIFIGSRVMRDGIRPDSMICVGNKIDDVSLRMDQGAPAQTRLDEVDAYCMYNIDGVEVFGKFSGRNDTMKMSIYTRVQHYLPWIASVVWPGEVA